MGKRMRELHAAATDPRMRLAAHLDGKVFLDRVFDTTSLATWAEFEKHKLEGFAERARALVKRWGS